MDLRLQILLLKYYYLDVLLMVTSKDLRSQCIVPAQELLNLLPRIGELLSDDTKDTHICMLWEWIHYPMIAFGTLWGQVLSNGVTRHDQTESILEVSGPTILLLQAPGVYSAEQDTVFSHMAQ